MVGGGQGVDPGVERLVALALFDFPAVFTRVVGFSDQTVVVGELELVAECDAVIPNALPTDIERKDFRTRAFSIDLPELIADDAGESAKESQ